MPFLFKVKSLTSKLGSKRRSKNISDKQQEQRQDETHAPSPPSRDIKPSSPHPPQPIAAWQTQYHHLPPLAPVTIPQVLPENQDNLALNGWTTVTYNTSSDPLYTSFQALLAASQSFFALPETYKSTFKNPFNGKQGSEEGWSRVQGEKEFITLRSLDNTPVELKDAASAFWSVAGGLLNSQLGSIAESLGLEGEKLTGFSEPCRELKEERTATMLRLFRYEGFDGEESKVVAEAHKDLGLLSLVLGSTPGLEVFSNTYQTWHPLEKSYFLPSASLLVGRQLERLSNTRYTAGGHRVRSYPNPISQNYPASSQKQYRYSIVFVLRAHSPVLVNTDELTTPITGVFERPMRGIRAGDMYKEIQAGHYNINTHVEEREEQRRKLAENVAPSAPLGTG